MEYVYHYESPLGRMTMVSDGSALTGLWFDDKSRFSYPLSKEHEEKAVPPLEETIKWLDIYFSGADPGFTPPVLVKGNMFRKRVWEILLTIPYGHTMTYSEIARIIAEERGIEKMSAQAVGGAVGHNPISLIIPCHRVTGANGSLTGYGGGIERKWSLLRMEGVDMSQFFIPEKGTAL